MVLLLLIGPMKPFEFGGWGGSHTPTLYITYQFGVHQFWRNLFNVLGHFLIFIHLFLLQLWIIPFEFTAVDGMAHLIVLAAERLFML